MRQQPDTLEVVLMFLLVGVPVLVFTAIVERYTRPPQPEAPVPPAPPVTFRDWHVDEMRLPWPPSPGELLLAGRADPPWGLIHAARIADERALLECEAWGIPPRWRGF